MYKLLSKDLINFCEIRLNKITQFEHDGLIETARAAHSLEVENARLTADLEAMTNCAKNHNEGRLETWSENVKLREALNEKQEKLAKVLQANHTLILRLERHRAHSRDCSANNANLIAELNAAKEKLAKYEPEFKPMAPKDIDAAKENLRGLLRYYPAAFEKVLKLVETAKAFHNTPKGI